MVGLEFGSSEANWHVLGTGQSNGGKVPCVAGTHRGGILQRELTEPSTEPWSFLTEHPAEGRNSKKQEAAQDMNPPASGEGSFQPVSTRDSCLSTVTWGESAALKAVFPEANQGGRKGGRELSVRGSLCLC